MNVDEVDENRQIVARGVGMWMDVDIDGLTQMDVYEMG